MMPPVNGNTALFLDIDGTLLDLARTPDRVKVPHDLLKALERLSRRIVRRASPLSAAVRWKASTSCFRPSSPPRSAPMAAKSAAWMAGDAHARVAGFGARGFHRPGREYSGPAAGRQEMRPGAALPAGAGSPPGPDLGDGKTRQAVRSREDPHSARQVGDRGQARWAWTRVPRWRRWPGRSRLPGAPSCLAATMPPIWMSFASCPIWAGAAFRWAGIFPAPNMSLKSPRAVRQWLTRTAEAGVR